MEVEKNVSIITHLAWLAILVMVKELHAFLQLQNVWWVSMMVLIKNVSQIPKIVFLDILMMELEKLVFQIQPNVN